MSVKFISYGGEYPCLCMGTLILSIDGVIVELDGVLESGGDVHVAYTYGDEDEVIKGPWSVDLPEEYEKYKEEITKIVNDNIPMGCCGGCI